MGDGLRVPALPALPSLHPESYSPPPHDEEECKGPRRDRQVSGGQLYCARGRGSPHPALALAPRPGRSLLQLRQRPKPTHWVVQEAGGGGGSGRGALCWGRLDDRSALPALSTWEVGALAEARPSSRGSGARSGWAVWRWWSAFSSCSRHLALSPWAAGTQAFLCFSQCLTWHSLQQYHSFWHREQRLEASPLQWAQRGRSGATASSTSSL